MAVKSRLSVSTRTTKKYIFARHSEKVIDPLFVQKASSILGAVVVVKQGSTREPNEEEVHGGVEADVSTNSQQK